MNQNLHHEIDNCPIVGREDWSVTFDMVVMQRMLKKSLIYENLRLNGMSHSMDVNPFESWFGRPCSRYVCRTQHTCSYRLIFLDLLMFRHLCRFTVGLG